MPSRRKYSRFYPRLKDGEKSALDKLRKPGETDRMLLLRLAGIEASPIPMGPRTPRMVSHDVLVDFAITDVHVVQGLDSGLEQQRLMDKMRRRKAGR